MFMIVPSPLPIFIDDGKRRQHIEGKLFTENPSLGQPGH